MKQLFFSLLIIVLTSASVCAQTPGDIFARYKTEKNAEYTHVGQLLFKLIRTFANHEDDLAARTAIHSIRSIRSLDLEDCSDKVKQQFRQSINNLRTKGYEEIVNSNIDGERALVLVRQKKNTIRELLLLNAGDDDCTMVQIKGKIKPNDVSNIITNVK